MSPARRRRARALLPAVAALLAAGCGQQPHEARLPLRLTVAPTGTLAPGDSLHLRAHLHNPTRHPLRMEFEDQCMVELYVQGPDRTVLHPPGGGATCVGAPATLEIPPRDSVPFGGAWLATYGALGEHVAFAVLWPYRVPHGDRVVEREGHPSNMVIFQVLAAPAE